LKVPADCPGEQSKEQRKKLKDERQKVAHSHSTPQNGTLMDTHASAPHLSRSDTVNSMNTLSSGYSATAQRSVSGAVPTPAEEPAPEKKPAPAARRNRIVAPPPAQYIKDDNFDGPPATTPKTSEQKGKMLYPYQQNGEGEITVPDGREVVILEPDGKQSNRDDFVLSLWVR
jgi:hypothetical protein